MPDTPPPAYSQLGDDPFLDNPSVPISAQPYGTQPRPIDYRALHGYGPGIPSPEDLIPPPSNSRNFHIVTSGTEIIITGDWAIAANRAQGIPGGLHTSRPTWEEALAYYTACFRDGSLKILPPRGTSATPGRSASRAVSVHSSAPTPTPGNRLMPIHVASSPISAPITTTRSAPAHTPSTPTRRPVAGSQSFPIMVTSSPVQPPATPEAVDKRSPGTIRRHNYTSRILSKIAGPQDSVPATWRDSTPVSIPQAIAHRPIASSSANADGRDHTAPSTPTKKGKEKEFSTGDSGDSDDSKGDSDDEYFPADEVPLTEQDLQDLYEWEQTLELQEALSSPRFD